MNYFLFPMETLNITQNYNGTTSHKKHVTGNPKDYPIDSAGADGGQSAIFAMNDWKVIAKRGMANSEVSNTVWLQSTESLKTPSGKYQVWMTLTHWNDGDTALKKWPVGSIISKGQIICYEGVDSATANHIHIVCGIGYSDNWVKNSAGAWVITGDSKTPESLMYIDKTFTTNIKNSGGLNWLEVPKENTDKDKIKELESLVNTLQNQINDLNNEVATLTKDNEELKNSMPNIIYVSQIDGYQRFKINLKENQILYRSK